MKKYIRLTATGLITALFFLNFTCREEDDVDLDVFPSRAYFHDVEGGDIEIYIQTPAAWTITKDDTDTWFRLDQMSGTGNATVTATASKNEGDERVGTITVTAEGAAEPCTVTLFQIGLGDPYLVTIPHPLEFIKEGGDTSFNLDSNVEWSVGDVSEEWITAVNPSSGKGSAYVTVTVAENTNEEGRQAILVFTGKGVSTPATVTIKQYGTVYY